MVLAGSQLNHRGMTMRSKKRVLVTAFGATVALTLQTPVSAFIVEARKASRRHGGDPPQSALLPGRRLHRRRPATSCRPTAGTGGGRRLGARGRPRQRAGCAPGVGSTSTLGSLDLGYLGAERPPRAATSSIGLGESATARPPTPSFDRRQRFGRRRWWDRCECGGGRRWWRSRRSGCRWRADGRSAVGQRRGRLHPRPVMRRPTDFAAGEFGTLPGVSAGRLNSRVYSRPRRSGDYRPGQRSPGQHSWARGRRVSRARRPCCSSARVSRAWPRVACAAAAPVEDSRRYAERPRAASRESSSSGVGSLLLLPE